MRLGVLVTTVLFVATGPTIILDNSSTPIQALARLLVNHTVAVTGNSTNFTSSTTSAQSVYTIQSLELPQIVETIVVWYVVNEAHEDTTQPWKHLSDLDPVCIPTNLTIYKGTGIAFLDADTPYYTPHLHISTRE